MINAATAAMAFHAMLPEDEVPEKTDGYEGFFHLTEMSGSVTEATLRYIIRDHDRERFEEKKALFADCAARLNEIYGDGTAEAQINDSYYNMKEKVLPTSTSSSARKTPSAPTASSLSACPSAAARTARACPGRAALPQPLHRRLQLPRRARVDPRGQP